MGESGEQFYYPLTDEKRDWSDFNLILPVVAVGNVGQLAIDILLSSLLEKQRCKFVGRIVSDTLMPVGGPNAYSLFFKSNEVMTTCQLYECVDHKLVIMQQRAPCFRERQQMFITQLTSWIRKINFKQVIVMSSSFSQFLASSLRTYERQPLRFMCTSSMDLQSFNNFTKELHFKPVEKVDRETLVAKEDGIIHLPGSGITKKLFESWQVYATNTLIEAQQIKTVILLLYCSEGDNRHDAFAFVKYLNEYIGVANTGDDRFWQPPISWKNLFGGKVPDGLY